jgi:glycosyltransferase involved in cell wall biosynthesis
MKKNKIAFIHTNIGDNLGGGGAQRFFINIFKKYYCQKTQENDLYFITDEKSYNNYIKSNFLSQKVKKKYFIKLQTFNNRFKHVLENVYFLKLLLFKKIDLVHICQYYHHDFYHLIKFINRLPLFIKPKIVVNFIHCNFPYEYLDKSHPNYNIFHNRFDPLFNNVKIDAIYSWYEYFKIFAEKENLFKHPTFIHAISTYCCHSDKFYPEKVKENLFIYASRLDNQKNPMMLLEAVKLLKAQENTLLNGWNFIICGNGPLKSEISEFINTNNLNHIIQLEQNINDMSIYLNRSKCFISTQNYENFTSLSMNEALASGNAIISRNVGQTYFYVKDGLNGYLINEDSISSLAKTIIKYLKNQKLHTKMQEASYELSVKTHNFSNFINEIQFFWGRVLQNQKYNHENK